MFWLLQFVSISLQSRYQGVCHFSAPTVCTKLVQSSYFKYNKHLAPTVCFKSLHSRYQGVCHFSAPAVCTKLGQSRYFEYNYRFGSYSWFQNHFNHDIREYAIFLLLHFVPNYFSQSIFRTINFLAPIVCFKITSFTI